MFDRPPTYRLPDDASPSGRATALSAPPRAPRVDQSAEPSLSFASRPADAALAPQLRDATIVRPDEPIPVGPGRPQPAYLFEDVDPPADFEPISRAKITPAPVRPETLHRGRLLDWLSRHVRRRLSFVVADAGYGKTTLLADFTQRGNVRCLWFKLDHTDGDWVTFINYLIAAYREAVPDFGRVTLPLLANIAAANPTRDVVLGTFMSELGRLTEEPMLLILDDYHLVDESSDVQLIMSRLLRDAPPTLSYVLLTRRKPELPIGRLSAMGEVSELETGDLRFTREETGRLFAEGYGQPLEDDVLDEVERRTEGWAASLQLLRSTLRGRSNVEVRAFVRQLSGATEPVYDFLAQEVLREATPGMRRFLVGTALLERIVPPHAVALFAADEPPPSEEALRERITEAYDVGLLGRRGESSHGFRYHPLLREFLLRQLTQEASPDEIREMHVRVAVAAERDAWLTSCRHYIAAGALADAARVLVRSVLVALGTGSWGAAAEIVAQLEGHTTEPDIEVILALQEIEEGRLPEALDRLEAIDLDTVGPTTRALVRHGLLRAHWWNGDLEACISMVQEIQADSETPQLFWSLAEGHRLIFSPEGDQDLPRIAHQLRDLAKQHLAAEFTFLAGISLHNAMVVEFYRGRYAAAFELGRHALENFRAAGHTPLEMPSTCAFLALCAAELRHLAEADEYVAMAEATGTRDVDALSEMAYLSSITGADGKSLSFLTAASDSLAGGRVDPAGRTTWAMASARQAIIEGDAMAALLALDPAEMSAPIGIAAKISCTSLQALALFAIGDHERAASAGGEALSMARTSGCAHWVTRMRVLVAASTEDRALFLHSVDAAGRLGGLALLDVAEVVAGSLHLLDALPECLRASMERWPERWRRVIRRVVSRGLNPASLAAARLLDRTGTLSDVPLLRAFERTYLKGPRALGLGRALARDRSPALVIHDFGRGRFEVGDRTVHVSSIRRRAAGLLCYLISRPNQTATREQVLEDMWPELSPAAASNSLNQTVYFLRRDIDPWYDEDTSVDYVANQGEVLWLDPVKVSIDSASFLKESAAALTVLSTDSSQAVTVALSYSGKFAPEFEYEDWAIDWRDHLHSTYLHLVQATQRQLASERDLAGAVALGRAALAVDPQATDIERGLVWCYAAIGSRAAAIEQYAHYASAYREQYAASPPSFDDVVLRGLTDALDAP